MQEPKITEKQVASIHLYFRAVAVELNNCGMSVKIALKKAPFIDSDWDEELVKKLLAKPLMSAVDPKKKTMRLTRTEASQLYEQMNRWTAENFGFSIPFPQKDEKE